MMYFLIGLLGFLILPLLIILIPIIITFWNDMRIWWVKAKMERMEKCLQAMCSYQYPPTAEEVTEISNYGLWGGEVPKRLKESP